MSVFTEITASDLKTISEFYSLDPIVAHHGVEAGVTNTIYRLDTDTHSYCLTIFESLNASEITPTLDFMRDLHEQLIPCPRVLLTRDRKNIITLQQKPAVLVEFLPGSTITEVTEAQCHSVGKWLARFHKAAQKSTATLVNTRDSEWHDRIAKKIQPLLTPPENAILQTAMTLLHTNPLQNCPQGIIHFDLFRDNVLLIDEVVTGLLDFYYACPGPLVLDLGVCINDWCRDDHGALKSGHYKAFLEGYEQERTLTDSERAQLPNAIILAALRFWLSRLHDQSFPAPGSLVQVKNPDYFASILLSAI